MKNSFLFIALFSSLFSSCRKDPFINPDGIYDSYEGTIYENCNGSVLKNEKVVLQFWGSGCFSSGVISSDTSYLDSNGNFYFNKERPFVLGTESRWYVLVVPRSAVSFRMLPGKSEFFPNDTIMNCYVRLHFSNPLVSQYTFYYQTIPILENDSYGNAIGDVLNFSGPFNDTLIQLPSLRIYNGSVHGIFHWGIEESNFYYDNLGSTWSGYYRMTHNTCATSDTFDLYIN